MVTGTKIYFSGGYNDGGPSKTVDIFDAVSGTWMVQTLNQSGISQSALLGITMVVAGGMNDYSNLSTRVEFIDLSNRNISVDCLMSPHQYGPDQYSNDRRIAVIGDKVYFSDGGFISVYDNTKKQWKYARVDTDRGILFTRNGQLYGLRFTATQEANGEFKVIKITL